MWESLYTNLINTITALAGHVLSIFPRSPFRSVIDSWDAPTQLGWLNWFFPVSGILSVIAVWLVAVSAYYLVSVIARWVKIVGE